MPSAGEQDADSAGKQPDSLPARALSGHKKFGWTVRHRAAVQARARIHCGVPAMRGIRQAPRPTVPTYTKIV